MRFRNYCMLMEGEKMIIAYDRREIFRMLLEIMQADEETFMNEFEGVTDQILAVIMGWA